MEQTMAPLNTLSITASSGAGSLNQAALDFVKQGSKLLLINGQWIPAKSGKTFETIDPTNEKVITTVALGDAEDIDLAVKAARRAFEAPSWANLSPYKRGDYLLKIADLIEAHTEELATIQCIDLGMLMSLCRSMTSSMADVFRYFAGWPTKIYGHTYPSDGSAMTYTLREPLGVIGAVVPWNGPMSAMTWKVAPALACGNTLVFKSAEKAPLVCVRMAELIQEAGLPNGVFNLVSGFGSGAGEALDVHPDVDKINFTGSTAVGKHILCAAAATMKKVTLELGGKSPIVIFPDADLEKAIPAAVLGYTAGAGQGCVDTTRIFIHESIYPEVAQKITDATKALKIGSPFEASTQIGPLVSQEQFDRVTDYIKIGKNEGATLTSGGKRHGTVGYYVEPTLFTDVKDGMRIAREEIFGPVGAMMSFKDEDEAIFRGNDVEYGLAASIWTKDISRAHRMARSLQAGMVWVNTTLELDAMAPFGGYKQSGVGRELGSEAIDEHTQTKTVVVRFDNGNSGSVGFV